MKHQIRLLLIFICGFSFSQTNRFVYELKYKLDSLQNEYETQEMVLDVNPNEVKFYEFDFIANDSLNNVPQNQYFQHTSQTGQNLIRKKNSNINWNYQQIGMTAFYYVFETNDQIKWNIQKEIKYTDNYKLQRATTTFNGRKWSAWFTSDIPINEGPYKFRGLPGLILFVEDSHQNFIYNLQRNQNLPISFDTSKFLENHYEMKAIKIDYKTWVKLNLDYYNDPYSSMRTNFQSDWNVQINGRKIKNKEEFNELTKSTQKEIKKYYNPIELDNAIPYPKK